MRRTSLGSLTRMAFRVAGLDLRRHRPAESRAGQVVAALKRFRIDHVLDIGAGSGSFAAGLFAHGFRGRVISFEPLSSSWSVLQQRASGNPLWTAAPRMALGSSTGERELYVSGNSNSSSVRKMNALHQTVAPHSRVVSTEVIQIRRLDDVAWTLVEPTSSLFLKLDVQGHEADVLEGAEQVLRRAAGLMVEMSLVELYEGQVLWRAMMDRLEALGFRLWNLYPGFSDRAVGRTLQFDATLFRM